VNTAIETFSDSFPYKPWSCSGMNFNPQCAAKILARKPQPVTWVWDSYIAEGDLFVFAAFMKVGKSTFIYPLAVAIARGLPFLERQTKKGGVLILALEEHPRDVELRLRKLGMTPNDPIYIHSGPLSNNEQALRDIRSFIQEKRIRLVLLDSLPYWWNVRNENDNAEINERLKPLLQLARETGAAIGLIHHESKYGGRDAVGGSQGDGKSIRGASALFGIVDQAILLDRRQGKTLNQRILKAIGRRSESPRELVVELEGNTALSDPQPYTYRLLGTPEALSEAAAKDRVWSVLTAESQEVKAVEAAAGPGKKVVREALEALVAEKRARREGKGVKGDPYKYAVEVEADMTEGVTTHAE